MFAKKDLIKINDYLWEIPKSFRPDMRVPARIYANEKMLESVFKDKSLEQLVNLTALPGIEKHALVMPDVHEGYGSPIGGVFATHVEDGIISPGAVGYDQNCLHPNSLVSIAFGAYLPIKKFKNYWHEFELPLIDKKTKQLKMAKIVNFIPRQENSFLYSIKTKSGFSLKATADHPIFTPQGMIKIETLKVGNQIITSPLKGIPYKKPKKLELINENKIFDALKKFDLPNNGNRWPQIIKWFKEKDFINLNLSSWQTPYLIKIISYLFGDGTINFIGKDKKGMVGFYGELEDLEQIKNDLKKIEINSKIYSRKRTHKIKNYYQKTYVFSIIEHCLHSNSTALVILLHLLGAPLGNKAYSKFQVPKWLWQAPLWQKRLFLAAFFGAEMSKPATLNKFNFYAPTLNINKAIPLKNNGIKFLNEIRTLLKEFGILSGKVVEVDGLANIGKTVGLRFQIESSSKKLIKFFEIIGFEYHREKQKLACLAIAYLKYKGKILLLRERVRGLVKSLYKQGVLAETLVRDYSENFIGKRFIEHSIWSDRGLPRIAFNFPSFEEYAQKFGFGEEGLIIDEVEEIVPENYQGPVYDLTVNDINHNFIASNFIVSNCGVRLLYSNKTVKEIEPQIENLAIEIQKTVPSGLGRGHKEKLSIKELDKILEGGAQELVKQGYGEKEDIENCEANGRLEWADAKEVSDIAKNRGRDQVGTLGSGNHFCELQKVEEILDKETAEIFGLFKNQIVLMIHTGSRGLGHQVATDYIRLMLQVMPKYNIALPDKELACAPFNSSEGQNYFKAMACGANFAWANRQMITHYIRKAWQRVLGSQKSKVNSQELKVLYDVAHNIAKLENNLIIHRKGATRAFPPGHPEIPEKYRPVGQPALIPGSMGTASFVLRGAKEGEEALWSSCHGAGRTMSRHQAIRTLSGKEIVKNLEDRGIIVKCYSLRGIAEESPQAYKNVDEVVEVVHRAGLSKKVARLAPLAVIKGE